MVMTPARVVLTNPLVVALFHRLVFVSSVEWIVALGLVIILASLLSGRANSFNLSPAGLHEPRNRTYLRMAFGVLWLVDGILQFQPSMPLGLANNVVAPTEAGTPHLLHLLMAHAITLWNEHPLNFAVGAAWIQVGIGVVLLTSNGRLGRAVAGVSAGWAALIWLIGNGAGGIFQSSSSILFGWPGATVFYVVAGVWLALSPTRFPEDFSRFVLRFVSVLVAIGAVLQLLPSRGFWQGGNANALTAMTQQMTPTPQPHWIAWIAVHGGTLAGTIGGGANLVVVFWLLVTAVGLWMAPGRQWRWPVWSLVVFCLVFWFVAQDAAFFGGLATDFNSLIPLAALTWVASPSLAARPALSRRLPREFRSSSGLVVASFATAMVAFSILSMGLVTFRPAETTFYVATNGLAASDANAKAPVFTLVDQHGARFTLGEHAGRFTLLTFLDPACYTDCSLMAAQLKQVRSELGPTAKIDIVVVAANPAHQRLADVRHFMALHQLNDVNNFYFVTGPWSPTSPIQKVWNSYGIFVKAQKGSVMSVHSDTMYVISPRGRVKWYIPDDPTTGASYVMNADESELISLLHQAGLH